MFAVLNVSQSSGHRMELVIIALIAVEVIIVSLAMIFYNSKCNRI